VSDVRLVLLVVQCRKVRGLGRKRPGKAAFPGHFFGAWDTIRIVGQFGHVPSRHGATGALTLKTSGWMAWGTDRIALRTAEQTTLPIARLVPLRITSWTIIRAIGGATRRAAVPVAC